MPRADPRAREAFASCNGKATPVVPRDYSALRGVIFAVKTGVTKAMGQRAPEFLLCLLAFSVVLGSSAEAASATKRYAPAAPQVTTSGGACRGANLFACGPVMNGNDYLGTDPDPFIRLMIQRDLGAKYGGGP